MQSAFSKKMKTMPMGLTSTPFISYHMINTKKEDLYEDAWGFNTEFSDVINLLKQIKKTQGKPPTKRLIERIRNEG